MAVRALPEVLTKHTAFIATLPTVKIESTESFPDVSPEGPKASTWVNSRLRRFFDCFAAGVALVLLSPLLAVCWALVRLTSCGPVLFRQRRMGSEGIEFELYKFRSMRVDCAAAGPSHTVHADSRVTAVGSLLRRFKLDELPQFWNVLKGDMSLVGPRPKLPDHEALHMPYRPGLTGEATLAFRNEERMLLEIPPGDLEPFYQAVLKPIKAEIDIAYMERATFASDLKILVQTLFRCVVCAPDGRRELEELLTRHSPKARDALIPRLEFPPGFSRQKATAFVPEFLDEFASNLDDAA